MSTDGPSTASGTASAHVEEPSGEALEVVVAEAVVATDVSGVQVAFDFDDHRRKAVEAYEKVRRRYEDCAESVYTVLKTALALEGLKVETPIGPITYRPFDHQSTMGAWVGTTKLDRKREMGIMVNWEYVPGERVLPSEAEVRKMREASR